MAQHEHVNQGSSLSVRDRILKVVLANEIKELLTEVSAGEGITPHGQPTQSDQASERHAEQPHVNESTLAASVQPAPGESARAIQVPPREPMHGMPPLGGSPVASVSLPFNRTEAEQVIACLRLVTQVSPISPAAIADHLASALRELDAKDEQIARMHKFLDEMREPAGD